MARSQFSQQGHFGCHPHAGEETPRRRPRYGGADGYHHRLIGISSPVCTLSPKDQPTSSRSIKTSRVTSRSSLCPRSSEHQRTLPVSRSKRRSRWGRSSTAKRPVDWAWFETTHPHACELGLVGELAGGRAVADPGRGPPRVIGQQPAPHQLAHGQQRRSAGGGASSRVFSGEGAAVRLGLAGGAVEGDGSLDDASGDRVGAGGDADLQTPGRRSRSDPVPLAVVVLMAANVGTDVAMTWSSLHRLSARRMAVEGAAR